MVTTDQQVQGRATVAQRWLARLGLMAVVAAVLVPLVAIGFRASVALVAVGLVGMGLAVAGLWWALTHRGVVRGLALVLVVAAPVAILVLYTSAGLAWVVVVAVALVGVAVAAGRAALARDPGPGKMPESDAPPPKWPFLIMNPRSGGGKVGVDGEALVLDTPVRCSIQPGVLRVRVPRNRPGIPDVTPQLNWKRLRQLALTGPGTGRAAPQDG